MRTFRRVEGLLQDLRYAVRMLLNSPLFTAATVLTLALGIGASTMIFSTIDAVLLRPLPVHEPDGVVSVFSTRSMGPLGDVPSGWSYPEYIDLRGSEVFDGVAAVAGVDLALDADGVTDIVAGQLVTGNYFDVLGVGAAVGRTFAPRE